MANLIPKIAELLGVKLGEEFKIMSGEREITKLQWEPQLGETYYSFSSVYGKWVVLSYTWKKRPREYALLKAGWIFRTKEEAQTALPNVAKEIGLNYRIK